MNSKYDDELTWADTSNMKRQTDKKYTDEEVDHVQREANFNSIPKDEKAFNHENTFEEVNSYEEPISSISFDFYDDEKKQSKHKMTRKNIVGNIVSSIFGGLIDKVKSTFSK